MELFEERRIAGEAARIKALHLSFELLYFTGDFGIALDVLTELIQRVHGLLEDALGIGSDDRGVRMDGGTGRVGIIARVDIPIVVVAPAPPARIVALAVAIIDDAIAAVDSSAAAVGAAGTVLTGAAKIGGLRTIPAVRVRG